MAFNLTLGVAVINLQNLIYTPDFLINSTGYKLYIFPVMLITFVSTKKSLMCHCIYVNLL